MSSLKDQIAIITGAGSGIGRAIALGLAAQGARLCLLGRKREPLEKIVEQAKSTNLWAKSYPIDLVSDKEIKEFAIHLSEDVRQVDLLIHSAGVISMGPFEQAAVDDFDRQYYVNLRAPYVLTQSVLPMMRPCQGQIVFINSSAGLTARAGVGQYAATKHALKAMADSLREELNAEGLRVLSLFLGRTATPMQAAVFKMEGKIYYPERLMQPEDVATMVISSLCLPKTAEVTDISIRPMQKF